MFIIFSFNRVVDILKERVVNFLSSCISGMADELLKLKFVFPFLEAPDKREYQVFSLC